MVRQVSGCERSRADDFSGRQRLGWLAPEDCTAEFRQAQGWAAQGILACPFFYELAIFQHSHLASRQIINQFADDLRTHCNLFPDYQGRMKSKARDEITGLKLPCWKRAIDDFKSQG